MLAACEKGNDKIAKLLIDAGANVNTADKVNILLCLLFSFSYVDILQYLIAAYLKGDVKIVKLLIDAGADVNNRGDVCTYTLSFIVVTLKL